MKRKVWPLFFIVLGAIVFGYIVYLGYHQRQVDVDPSDIQTDSATRPDVVSPSTAPASRAAMEQVRDIPVQNENVPTSDTTEVDDGQESSDARDRWEAVALEVGQKIEEYKQKGQECEADMAELFDDPNFVDPRSEFYANPEYPMMMIDSIMGAALHAYTPQDAYIELESAVEQGLEFDTKQLNQFMMEMHGCLSPRIEIFLMTFFDSAQVHDYGPEIRSQISVFVITYLLDTPMLEPPTLLSLSFQINVLQGMARNGLIPSETLTRLEDIQMGLMDGHRAFSEVVYGDDDRVTARDRREEMYSDFRNREVISEEINDILRQLRASF